jgi:hypothetical protein
MRMSIVSANRRKGYKEITTHRRHMAREGNRHINKDEEMKLDGIGGVNILVKGDVHRSGKAVASQEYKSSGILTPLGINFPCYPFENQAETEGFAKMANRAGYSVYGLPNYVVWHIDTEEKGGNA